MEKLDKFDKIVDNIERKQCYDEDYYNRRSQQIIEAKIKANKRKRANQKLTKKLKEKEQKEKDAISISLIQESVKEDLEMLM